MKFLFFYLLLLSLSSFASEEYTQEKIINEFISLQNQGNLDEERSFSFKNPYTIPPLHKVIPVYLQKEIRKRNNNHPPLSFNKVRQSVDLRYRDTPIRSQVGARCSAYGLVASIENLLGSPKISESHLWSNYRAYSSAKAVEAAKRMEITEYKAWPDNQKKPSPGWEDKPRTGLAHITFIEDDVLKAVEALNENRSVYIGMSVTKSMANCDVVMDPNSRTTGGGHAVGISGYVLDQNVLGGGYFIMKNSWGADCGDNGYQYLPFHYCMRGGSSYCVMWDVEGVKTTFPDVESVIPEFPKFDLKQINVSMSSYKKWFQRNRTVTIKVEGRSLHVRQIKNISYSIDDGDFSEEIKNDLDRVTLSFKTRSLSHIINLRMNLINGQTVTSKYQWKYK